MENMDYDKDKFEVEKVIKDLKEHKDKYIIVTQLMHSADMVNCYDWQ